MSTPSRLSRFFTLSTALLALAASCAVTQAATLRPDNWHAAGPAGSPAPDGSWIFVTNQKTAPTAGIQHILTHFAPVSLARAGDSIEVSLVFSGQFSTPLNRGYVFGLALYDAGGKRISASGLGQSTASFPGYRGYRVGIRPQSAQQKPLELRVRTTGNTALGNTSAAHATLLGEGGTASPSALVPESRYAATLSLTRVPSGDLSVTANIQGEGLNGYRHTWTVPADHIIFDTFAISLGSPGISQSITIHEAIISTKP